MSRADLCAPLLSGIATMRDVERLERLVPLDQRGYAETTVELLDRACERFSPRPCLTQVDDSAEPARHRTVTYAEFVADVRRCAALFRDLGVTRSGVVSYLTGASIETETVIWGAQAAGIVNPINPYLEPQHIGRLLREAGTVVLVTEMGIPGLSIWDKIAAILDDVPTLRAVLMIGHAPDRPTIPRGRVPVLDFQTELARRPDRPTSPHERPAPGDTAALFHTGGTTGAPKLAVHTHRNEALSCQLFADILGWTTADTLLVGLPLFHVNGVLLTGLTGFAAGCHIVLAGRAGFRTPGALDCLSSVIERYSVSFLSAVPTVYASWLERAGHAATVSLRFGISGGAPMSAELARRVETRTGIRILEGYGLTEGTLCSALNPVAGERRPGSVGLRVPYQELRIVRLDSAAEIERDCAAGEIGEIVIRGPNVIPGYRDAEATRRAFTSDGYFRTGDLARRDMDGYVWIVGRSKDIIIRSGHNIEPAVIEEAFEAHDAVVSAAAVGQLDEYAGELPVVFLVLRPGQVRDESALLDFARERITERAALPARIIVVDQLPVTAVGKVDKAALRIRAAEWVVSRRLAAAGLDKAMPLAIHANPALTAVLRGSAETDAAREIRRILSALGMSVEFENPQPQVDREGAPDDR